MPFIVIQGTNSNMFLEKVWIGIFPSLLLYSLSDIILALQK